MTETYVIVYLDAFYFIEIDGRLDKYSEDLSEAFRFEDKSEAESMLTNLADNYCKLPTNLKIKSVSEESQI